MINYTILKNVNENINCNVRNIVGINVRNNVVFNVYETVKTIIWLSGVRIIYWIIRIHVNVKINVSDHHKSFTYNNLQQYKDNL
jgi:hypothetical protein